METSSGSHGCDELRVKGKGARERLRNGRPEPRAGKSANAVSTASERRVRPPVPAIAAGTNHPPVLNSRSCQQQLRISPSLKACLSKNWLRFPPLNAAPEPVFSHRLLPPFPPSAASLPHPSFGSPLLSSLPDHVQTLLPGFDRWRTTLRPRRRSSLPVHAGQLERSFVNQLFGPGHPPSPRRPTAV